jgi:signal transduction histidine kinase
MTTFTPTLDEYRHDHRETDDNPLRTRSRRRKSTRASRSGRRSRACVSAARGPPSRPLTHSPASNPAGAPAVASTATTPTGSHSDSAAGSGSGAAGGSHAVTPANTYPHGPDVSALQHDLGLLNYYENPVDGVYGPATTAAVTGPAVVVYLASLIAAQNANGEPWASIVLRTWVMVALTVGCVLLSWIQRSRVLTIAALAQDRTTLLGDLVDVEARARTELAEDLHDGALQYVLAARHDLEDARDGNTASLDRIEFALRESTTLLRAKVSQLHPAVLDQAGLLRALNELARTTAERSGLRIELSADGWDDSSRSGADELLYTAAREFLVNVTKHAEAQTVRVTLRRANGDIGLTVADDGKGIEAGVVGRRLAEGHVGVTSQQARVQTAGGHLSLSPGTPGTVAEVELPDTALGTDAPPLEA